MQANKLHRLLGVSHPLFTIPTTLNLAKTQWRYLHQDVKEENKLTVVNPREIFQREYPNYYSSDGKFVKRIPYVDFIDEALSRLKELGLDKNLDAYKELMRVFPPGKYVAPSWYIGMYAPPQQLCAIRVLFQMEMAKLSYDKEMEEIITERFDITSDVWVKMARGIYWQMKRRNLDPNPLPEVIPKKTHELAKLALLRMNTDNQSIITVTNASSLENVVDKTWIVSTQSPSQQQLIENLDEKSILYIEELGFTYVKDSYLSYYALKVYDDEETIKLRAEMSNKEPDFNYNTLKVQFYGKPLREKLEEMNGIHRINNYQVLAIGITGTSSHDSILSWLKFLHKRNPKLKDMSVVFRLKRRVSTEVLDPSSTHTTTVGQEEI